MDLKWALAFIEGEGSFFIAITRNRAGWYLRPRFSVSLHEKEQPLLEIMEQLFNKYDVKTLLRDDGYKRKKQKKRSRQLQLSVRGTNQCRKLADLFRYMKWYSKKYRDFLIWEFALQIFEEMKLVPHSGRQRKWTDQRVFDMVYLRSYMNVTKRRPRSNRNQAKILAWDLKPAENILSFLAGLDKQVNEMREERRGFYLGPGDWIEWLTLAELQERVGAADDPKKYALSLWEDGPTR